MNQQKMTLAALALAGLTAGISGCGGSTTTPHLVPPRLTSRLEAG